MMQQTNDDCYFGGCPVCGKRWLCKPRPITLACLRCFTASGWYVGQNLFSSWKDESEDDSKPSGLRFGIIWTLHQPPKCDPVAHNTATSVCDLPF